MLFLEDAVYIGPDDHIQDRIRNAASNKTPSIPMNEIPVDDFEEGKIWCCVKPSGNHCSLI